MGKIRSGHKNKWIKTEFSQKKEQTNEKLVNK
jgi:hypothetical protein